MTDAKSVISETLSTDHSPGNIFDDSEDYEIQERIENFEREILQLKLENTLFEANLDRKKIEPIVVRSTFERERRDSLSQTTTTNGNNHETSIASSGSRTERAQRKRSKSRSTQADFRLQLTIEQKLEIAIAEYEFTRNEKFRCDNAFEKGLDQLESDLEWIENEIADVNISIADFLKLKDTSIDKRTKTFIGEKFAHYFNERLKARQSLINKLLDRSSGFKRQIIRLDNQIRQKQMGDTLQEVDFNQLKIENKQYLDKIDEKNLELVILKRQVAKFSQVLNRYKDELHNKIQELIDTEKRIEKQDSLYEYTQHQMSTASIEQKHASRKHLTLVEQTENYRVPDVLDYVRKKALLINLQRDCEVWKRKVELVSMGFQQTRQQWLQVQRTARYN